MGCGNSSSGGGGGGGADGGGAKSSNQSKRLLDTYNVGEMLGQGAFGIVYACKPHGQDRECAVKMVDKVETPLDKIKEEAEMLKKMDHPNVIKCHDVIYEKCFVCIVMDRLRGGDLIVGMQAHWKSKGKIPVMKTIPISAQMISSIQYLHKQKVIHRDVKGDNYLCDRNDIVENGIRIVLTDFGTACDLQSEDDRLKEKCGTKLYWSPEFYKLVYGLKVDIWAVGVVVYGLLNGKFPFRDEKDMKSKQVTTPKGTPPDCDDFVKKLLALDEKARLSADDAAKHPWIAKQVSASDVGNDSGEAFTFDAEAFAEGGANQGVADRRNELVERLQEAGGKNQKKAGGSTNKPEEHYWKEWFSIVDRHAKNSTLKYEWWSQAKVDEAGILSMEGAKAINESMANSNVAVINKQLTEHGIDTSKFGKGTAKPLVSLAGEVQSGSAVLMLDASSHKKLVRVVDIVLLRISPPGPANKNKFLLEVGEQYEDGRQREVKRLPGTKKEPAMNSKQVAEKICSQMLDLGGAKVNFDWSTKEVFEEEEESPSYPGVTTAYRKEIISGTLTGDANNFIGKNSKPGKQDWKQQDPTTKNTKFFAWMTDKDCQKNGVKYEQPSEQSEVSGLVQAPIGYEEEELAAYFTKHKVDVSKFGLNQAKTLKDISAELIKGESSLMEAPDSVIRVVDVVVIKLIHSVTGSILVQTEQTYPDGNKVSLKRLPGAKRRPDENQFLTARRILKRQLKVEENHVTLDASDVKVAEEEKESLAYPGLRTVYRKRIITASLSK